MNLKLNWNSVRHIGDLEYMTSLEVVFLKGNWIGNISVLSNLRKLRKVHIFFNQITDLSPLADLQYLDTLTAERNPIRKNTKNCPVGQAVPQVLRKFCKEYLGGE
ncbi:MAG: hypothetical protein E2O68_01785 [Deltaproteobacteria bacterium]|nr:MAG: hypothetical protein E2O68_01785 [Deltaproteobacteria bacterium]